MATTPGPLTGQWLRYAQLIVSSPATPTTSSSLGITNKGSVDGVTTFATGVQETPGKSGSGIDLSQLRFKFEVRADDSNVPNTLLVRIYNVSPNTLQKLLTKSASAQAPAPPTSSFEVASNPDTVDAPPPPTYSYNHVTLVAGYQNGNKATIFQGDVIQYAFGKEQNVDSYLELRCADGDVAINQAIVSQSQSAGGIDADVAKDIATTMGVSYSKSNDSVLLGGIIPRGKVQFALGKSTLDKIARNSFCRWSIQNGTLVFVPVTGYLPGEAVVINSASGMIGTPEQTDNGIIVRCYINPLIKIGQLIKLNNGDINQQIIAKQGFYPEYTSQYYVAPTSADGTYRVLVAEHVGDTRGNDWYTEITALAVDLSGSPDSSVLAGG